MNSDALPPVPPARVDPAPRRRRALAAFSLVCILGASVYLAYSWQQFNRAGKRHFLRGMDYAAQKDYKRAEAEWVRGMQEDPNSPLCFERVGDLYREVRRYQEAAVCYTAASRLDTNNAGLFLNLARVQGTLGNKREALRAAKRAAELLPDDPEAQGLYGMIAARQYERGAAQIALKRAYQLNPANTEVLFALINLEMDQMNFAATESDLAPFLRAHPDNAQACYYMALLNRQKPRTPRTLADAITYARRAMPGLVKVTRGYALLGNLYLEAKNPQKALLVFRRGYEAFPGDEGILQGLVLTFRRLGDMKRAALTATMLQQATARHNSIMHLRHVMGFNHYDVKAGLELSRLLEENGDAQQAFQNYQDVLRMSPRSEETRRAFSAYLKRTGRPDMAATVEKPDFVPR